MLTLDELNSLELADEVIDVDAEAMEAWLEKRRGRITASNFQKLLPPGKKGEDFTQTGLAYLHMVIAERLGSWHEVNAKSLQWGIENEDVAKLAYVERTGASLCGEPYHYIELNNDIGGTPDDLVGVDGCIEIKCPHNPAVHVNTLIRKEVPKEYTAQVLGHLLVTGRSWCDFISFDPRMEGSQRLAIIRVERDEARIEHLKQRLMLAAEYVNKVEKDLTA